MPAFLLKLLPYGAAALALLGVVWWIDSNAVKRTENMHKLEQAQADVRAMDLAITFGDALGKAISKIDADLATRIADIDIAETTIIKPTVEREILRESRLSDPAVGITDGLREAVNAARAQSACHTAPDGSATCALPAPVPTHGQ